MKRITIAIVGVVAAAVLFVACTRIPPVRVLPRSINSIYIATFNNKSYEPGIEEKLTRLTQEEFLADGRLDVVRRPNADAMLTGTINKFNVRTDRDGVDRFPLTSRIFAVADVALYDPSDRQRTKPIMSWSNVDVELPFVSDARRIIKVTPSDAHEETLRQLARQIVYAVLTRRPDEVTPGALTTGAPIPGTPQRALGTEKSVTRPPDSPTSEPLTSSPADEKKQE